MCKINFTKEEDYVIGQECTECFSYWDTDTEESVCDCGRELINHTSHEGVACERCGHTFDCWESWYFNSDIEIICKDCYEELS